MAGPKGFDVVKSLRDFTHLQLSRWGSTKVPGPRFESPLGILFTPCDLFSEKYMAGPKGFEPLTLRLRAVCSTWLSYGPVLWRIKWVIRI